MTAEEIRAAGVVTKAADVWFFWTEGGKRPFDDRYHWCVDCAWLLVAAWHGARVLASETPPPEAGDAAEVRQELEEHLEGPAWPQNSGQSSTDEAHEAARWLCEVCSEYVPRPVAAPRRVETEPCVKCGCSREMHTIGGTFFDWGCGMAWLEADADEELGFGLIHCPCDGFEPAAGGRPWDSSEFREAL